MHTTNLATESQSATVIFTFNFKGRLKKIDVPKTKSIRAVFEAVANSFDSVAQMLDKGQIIVRILFNITNPLRDSTTAPEYEVAGIEIEDNGEGFNDDNMRSFLEIDTTDKPGGKGVGRLLWLHVFQRVEIDSVYRRNEQWLQRKFPFSLSDVGKDDDKATARSLPPGVPMANKTVVRLLTPLDDRGKYLKDDVGLLAELFLEHFLLRFTVARGPSLKVVDSRTGQLADVGEIYAKTRGNRHKQEPIILDNLSFALHHLFVTPSSSHNVISFCASERVIDDENEKLSAIIHDAPNKAPVTIDGLRYHAYVTGPYLDKICDEDRVRLKWPKEREQDTEQPEPLHVSDAPIDEVTKKELLAAITPKVREHLADCLANVRQEKEKKLDDFVANEQPQFRPFAESAKKRLDKLPPKPSSDDIELFMYGEKMDGRQAMEKTIQELLEKNKAAATVTEYQQVLLKKFASEQNRHNQSALIEYVCMRKAVIQVLAAFQKKGQDGSNQFEEAIHDLMFPMKATSDDIPVGPNDDRRMELENLWLIDERLVFHKLLCSDKPLDSIRGFHSNAAKGKSKKPDITVFDPAFTTSEGRSLRSIAIIEFKRPGRKEYTDADNPVRQLINAAEEIRAGQCETIDGELVKIDKDVMIFGYGLCDLTPEVVKFAKLFDMKKTADEMGYQKYHQETHMLMELVTYQKLIDDADRRNKGFFMKLGM